MRLGITISLAAVGLALGMPNFAHAQDRSQFTLGGLWKGAISTEQCYENLCVNIYVKRPQVNGDKVEICAEFTNEYSEDTWAGAYRLTNRDDPTTFASLRVPGGDTRERCEILPATRNYFVVLREDDE